MRIIFFVILFSLQVVGCRNKKPGPDPDFYYTCSMDPQVVSDRPGKCPICKMELTAIKKSTVKLSDDIQLSDQQIQLGNILTDTISSQNIGNEIVLLGTLNLNGMKTSTVSARVMGRVEKLYTRNIGDQVFKGMPLYEIYSEELNNALSAWQECPTGTPPGFFLFLQLFSHSDVVYRYSDGHVQSSFYIPLQKGY